jgi:serine/threonine protein kinase
LRHPAEPRGAAATVTIYDWGDDQGAVYVAMELVDGPSLAEAIRDAQRLGIDRTVNMGIGVAQALDAAHQSGLVHGSLTPRDVLMAQDNTVKVTDFGTATAGLASLGDPIANALYQSPEQLRAGRPCAAISARSARSVRGRDRGAPFTGSVFDHATQADGSPDSTVDVHHGIPPRSA